MKAENINDWALLASCAEGNRNRRCRNWEPLL